MSDSKRRPARHAIVVGAVCFGLGSMVMVQADVLPPEQQFGIRDPFDDTALARVTPQGALAVADERADLNFHTIISQLAELDVSVPGGVEINNLPSVQTVDGSVTVTNLPAVQAVAGEVSVGNPVQVYATANRPLITIPISDIAPPFVADLNLPAGQCTQFVVPANYRLVIQTITAFVVNRGDAIVLIEGQSGGTPVTYTVATNTDRYSPSPNNFTGNHVATHAVTLRLDGGAHRMCNFSQQSVGHGTITGYLLRIN